jgi:hypothetical protein
MAQPRIYIPVDENYRMPGALYRLGDPHAGDRRVEIDEERDRYLRSKRPASGWDSLDSRTRLETYLSNWMTSAIQEDQPDLRIGSPTLDGLIGAIQEDVVFMHRDHGQPAHLAKAVYVNVSFPSGWCPACARGKTFMRIHGPVPINGDFDGAGRRAAADELFAGNPKVRFVWTLTPDDALDRRKCDRDAWMDQPHSAPASSWRAATRMFLRVERQVIAPIDADTACFFIRIYRYDLTTLEGDVRERIRSSVLGMPDNVRAYKGFAEHFDVIRSLI